MHQKISSSASKIVLLFLVGILGLMAMVAGIYSILTDTYGDAATIILIAFSNALSLVLGYYFNSKGDPTLPNSGK